MINNNFTKDKPSDREINLKNFEIRRAMIVHEDAQINSRLTMLIQMQGWLMAPTIILMAHALSEKKLDIVTLILVLCFVAFGLLASIHIHNALTISKLQQSKVLDKNGLGIFSFVGKDALRFESALKTNDAVIKKSHLVIIPMAIYFLWALVFIVLMNFDTIRNVQIGCP